MAITARQQPRKPAQRPAYRLSRMGDALRCQLSMQRADLRSQGFALIIGAGQANRETYDKSSRNRDCHKGQREQHRLDYPREIRTFRNPR